MPNAQNKEMLASIKEDLTDVSAVWVVDYRGLTVKEIQNLRNSIREADACMKVYKNTLMHIALEELDMASMDEILDYLDTDSLYAPVEGIKAFVPQEIQSILPDEKVRGEKREAMWLKLERTLSPDKIAAYVREQLGDRTSMLASELPLAEDGSGMNSGNVGR